LLLIVIITNAVLIRQIIHHISFKTKHYSIRSFINLQEK